MLILLIGHQGQIGHALASRLGTLGEVVTPDRKAFDLSQPTAIDGWIRERSPDLIVNAAAYTDVDGAESDEARALVLNGVAVGAIGSAAAAIDARVVHYSTDYVFDGTATAPITPGAPTAPINAYGRTKLDGERRLAASNASSLLLRTAWVYSHRRRNFLRTIERLADERDSLRVVNDQFGSPTPASVIAEATVTALPAWLERDGAGMEVHHVVCRGATTWCRFARRIVEGRGDRAPQVNAISTAEFPTPAVRPPYAVLDPSSFESTFGVTLPTWEAAFAQVHASRTMPVHSTSNASSK